jgi:hypothetical protein
MKDGSLEAIEAAWRDPPPLMEPVSIVRVGLPLARACGGAAGPPVVQPIYAIPRGSATNERIAT